MNLAKAHIKIDSTKVAHTMKQEIQKDVEAKVITSVYAAFLISLHDEFDFGPVRLNRLLERVDKQFDAIMEDYCTVEDIKQAVFDETKIDLR